MFNPIIESSSYFLNPAIKSKFIVVPTSFMEILILIFKS
ncbi:hypothetical protein LEP1GSC172_2863 [Leptospira noguchii]|uniref:Uncharacterized protein n=2 Tax=Leptospira noguchii TaxID=28182 RepID=T0FW85_9LEPT|nr:hypothetical protein LEP1GSC172_2863 [Leptospira noguchii]EQA73810.1 hypothetical protein LEP1GSC059_4110 [Leptospira noguchii serovar Panama str. CZ214]